MKLRLRGNSLRLRLTRNEVTRLADCGLVEETVTFGTDSGSVLVYRIRSAEAQDARHAAGRIDVTVTASSVREWADGPAEGIYFETAAQLRVAVEKDFRCLAPREGEDDSDAYEHPGGTSTCSVSV
jgi:hypothetical protein